MKKLMIAAAIVCAAAFVQAAEYNWGFQGFDYLGPDGSGYSEDDGGNFWKGGTAYLFLGTVTASDTEFDLSKATYITKGGWDGENYIYGNGDAGAGITSADVKSTDAGQAFSLIMLDKDVESLVGYEGNYVLVNSTSLDPLSNASTGNLVAQFNYNDPVGSGSASWKVMGVPEPTSGLLLLLGVAGLALRRRRA